MKTGFFPNWATDALFLLFLQPQLALKNYGQTRENFKLKQELNYKKKQKKIVLFFFFKLKLTKLIAASISRPFQYWLNVKYSEIAWDWRHLPLEPVAVQGHLHRDMQFS